ncbi:hypothetical protein Q604_UNBC18735G0004 [human gut metagenome]|uniref:Uncharacterized protein n=1 Tax=human gut metagenome TaxID=408170 RepID=W1WHL3_9ZZZZ
MGILNSIGSAISGAISVVGSLVSSLSSSIGGAIAKLAPSIIKPFLGLEIGNILIVIQVIATVIGRIADMLGVKEKEDSTEEIGMKAEEAEKKDIKPENFDSYQEYINYIRQEIEIDKKKLNNLSDEEKVKYGTVGTAILVKGIEEKEKFEIPAEFVVEIGKQDMSMEETRQYIKEFKEQNLELKDFTNYLKGTIDNVKTIREVGHAIESAIKELNPDMSDRDLEGKILHMENNSRE